MDLASTRPPFLCNRNIVDAYVDIGIDRTYFLFVWLDELLYCSLIKNLFLGYSGIEKFGSTMATDIISAQS